MEDFDQLPARTNTEIFDPMDSVSHLMRRVAISIRNQADIDLEATGLTPAQWMPLYHLHFGQASTAAELAVECGLDAGAMTRTLDRLERKQLVRRTRSKTDRRVVEILITAEGRSIAEAIPKTLCDAMNAHLGGFASTELALLKSMLTRVQANLLEMEQRKDRTHRLP